MGRVTADIYPAGSRPTGTLLRDWRARRRLSQLDVALRADISARHLSFVETGRSRPSSGLILRLADCLDIPLRERNRLLLAAGYAPAYPQHQLGEPPLSAVATAMRHVLTGHEPWPALAVDRHWEMVDSNAAAGLLLEGAAADLLEPPVNVLRLCLHPDGLAPRIVNLGEWHARILGGLRRQADVTGDPFLSSLHDELRGYPGGQPAPGAQAPPPDEVVSLLRLWYGDEELAFFTTTTVFGRPRDVTVAELAIESFYPADEATAKILRSLG